MSTALRVTLPSGEEIDVYYEKDQSKLDIANNKLLPYWQEYCHRHWMSENHEYRYSPENMVKQFLDDVGYLLLRDNPKGTLTHYKEIMRGSTEINVSSCPASIEDQMYGNGATLYESNDFAAFARILEDADERAKPYKKEKPRKQWPPTKFDKIERVKRELPGCTISTYPVDTENIFEHSGVEYQISDDVTQYQPRKTREGLQYDMDRVMVVETNDGELRFYDQSFDRIPDEEIALVEP